MFWQFFSAIEVDSKLKNTANKKVLFYFNWWKKNGLTTS